MSSMMKAAERAALPCVSGCLFWCLLLPVVLALPGLPGLGGVYGGFRADNILADTMDACPRGRLRAPVIIGGPPPESATCKRLRVRLERIQASLRAGYREPRGARLREQRRQVNDQWLTACFP